MTASAAAAPETEVHLVQRAQFAVSRCNWEVGECASLWTKRFAKGRTDADFAQLVGLSPDQVYQRRRVWETFADVSETYSELKWSHFYSALTWDDAAECLQWAQDVSATVAEMRAWRRAQRGEDLSLPGDDDPSQWMPMEPSEVRVPRDAEGSRDDSDAEGGGSERAPAVPVAAGFARESSSSGDEYAPFRPDAMVPPAKSTEASSTDRPTATVDQLVRRLTTTLERCAAAMTTDFLDGFADVPEKDQKRFLKAVAAVNGKAAELE